MRKLTLVVLVWSMETVVAGDALSDEKSEEHLRKGTLKFFQLSTPPHDSFYPDDQRCLAHLLGYTTKPGVVSIAGFLIDTDGQSWMVMRCREVLGKKWMDGDGLGFHCGAPDLFIELEVVRSVISPAAGVEMRR
jgi:hypothetical protein